MVFSLGMNTPTVRKKSKEEANMAVTAEMHNETSEIASGMLNDGHRLKIAGAETLIYRALIELERGRVCAGPYAGCDICDMGSINRAMNHNVIAMMDKWRKDPNGMWDWSWDVMCNELGLPESTIGDWLGTVTLDPPGMAGLNYAQAYAKYIWEHY